MSRQVGQIIARGERRWLVRVYLGRDRETRKRTYHNRTIYAALSPRNSVRAPAFTNTTSSWSLISTCPPLKYSPAARTSPKAEKKETAITSS